MHRKSKISKRYLSYLLALVMVMTSFTIPTTAFADEINDGEIVEEITTNEAIVEEELDDTIAEEDNGIDEISNRNESIERVGDASSSTLYVYYEDDSNYIADGGSLRLGARYDNLYSSSDRWGNSVELEEYNSSEDWCTKDSYSLTKESSLDNWYSINLFKGSGFGLGNSFEIDVVQKNETTGESIFSRSDSNTWYTSAGNAVEGDAIYALNEGYTAIGLVKFNGKWVTLVADSFEELEDSFNKLDEVTMYVYEDDGNVPALYLWYGDGGVQTYPLSNSTGELTPNYTGTNEVAYKFSDASSEISEGWYKITFKMDLTKVGEVFDLISMNGSSLFWDNKILFSYDGTEGTVDASVVLTEEKIYYKDGAFVNTLATTLSMLRNKVDSVETSGYSASHYTSSSFANLSAKLEAAKVVCNKAEYKDLSDEDAAGRTGDDISTAYDELNSAVKGLKDAYYKEVTLYYYDGNNAISDGHTDEKNYFIMSWDNPGNKLDMTEVPATSVEGHDKWYAITIGMYSGIETATSGAGFQIDTASWGDKIEEFKYEDEEDNIYKKLIVSSKNGDVFYLRNGELVDSFDITLFYLRNLIQKAEDYIEEYYTSESFSVFSVKLNEAKIEAEKYSSKNVTEAKAFTTDVITDKYLALNTAVKGLIPSKRTINFYIYSETNLNGYSFLAYGKDDRFMDDTTLAVVAGEDNWYIAEVALYNMAVIGKEGSGFEIDASSDWKGNYIKVAHQSDWSSYPEIYDYMVGLNEGESVYVKWSDKDKSFIPYDSLASAMGYVTLSVIEQKISTVKDDYLTSEKKGLYSKESYEKLEAVVNSAENYVAEAKAAIDSGIAVESDYYNAFAEKIDEINEAIGALMSNVKSEINVAPVTLNDGFMSGADISSFYALSQAGTVFKDENGKALSDKEFFKYLKDGGMDWARIRIWNDPYDSSGNGYGGGNNDLTKAIAMGKLATDAGMKVLIDFHYSDFWADPSKYKAPKAWEGYTNQQKADALYDFTKDSIYKLLQAGVDVGMVQIGNESNHGLAGETDGDATKLYGYGVEAVHDATDAYYGKAIDKGEDGYIKTAIHLTDVQNGGGTVTTGLTNQVSKTKYTHRDGSLDYVWYDAVGVSYYPMYRHGTINNLETVLADIASNYGPDGHATEVFVAETSWATSWGDGDGFANSGPSLKGQDTEAYSISVQGQADELRAVVNAVNNVPNEKGVGVFYWEPAWIAPYVACYDDYTWNDAYYAKNKEAWEKYGIGWAASYSYEYDPTDAGLYYGGVCVDNMSWFDFDGTALPTAKIYSLIKTGSTAKESGKLVGIKKNRQITISLGDEIEYPQTIEGYLNDYNTTQETVDIPVKWNSSDKAKVDVDKAGYYTVNGTATYNDGSKYAVILTIQVTADNNIYLQNESFEEYTGSTGTNVFSNWEVRFKLPDGTYIDQTKKYHFADEENSPYQFSIENNNSRSGNGALNFWKKQSGLNITVTQKLGNVGKGQYTFGGYFEGGSAGEFDKQYAVAYVYESETKYLEDYNNNKPLGTSAIRKYRNDGQFGGWLSWQNVEIPRIEVSNSTEYLVVGFEFNGTPSGVWGSVDDAYLYGNYTVTVNDTKGGVTKASNYSPSINAKVSISAKPDKGMAVSSIKVVGAEDLSSKDVDVTKNFNGWTIDPANPKVAVFNNIDKTAAIAKANFRMPATNVTVEVEYIDPLASGTPKLTLDNVVSVGGLTSKPYAFVATGKALTPAVVLNYNGYTLTKSDFKATYKNNVSAGEAGISITGKGKFAGATLDIPFTIKDAAGKDISKDFTIEMAELDAKNAYYYTGEAIEPLKAIKASNGAALNKGTDYTVTYTKNIKVGTATMYAVGVGEYTGSVKKTFKIAKADIEVLIEKGLLKVNGRTGDTVAESALSNGTYIDGKKGVEPGVTVRYGASMLKQKKDYKVSYKNNKKITEEGKFATAVIKGSGNFTGSYTLKFKVEPRSIADTAAVRVVIDDMVDNGKDITPKVTVYAKSLENKEKTIKKDNYFISCIKNQATGEVIYNDGKSVSGNQVDGKPTVKGEGIYTVYVAGQKNLKDYVEVTDVRVRNKDYVLKASNVKFGKIYYTGHEIKVGKPLTIDTEKTGALSENSIRVVAGNGTVLDEKSFMITEYKNNRKSGTAQIRVKGIGDYAGSFTKTFKINKLKLVDEEAYNKLAKDGKTLGYATTSLKDMEQSADTTYGYMHYYNGYKQTPEYAVKVTTINDKFKINPNKDYKLVYKNNDKPNDFDGDGLCDSDKKPIIATIKGVGNYTGSIKIEMKNTGYKNSDAREFAMTKRTIKDFSIQIDTATVEGKVAKPVPTFFDEYGVAVYINPKVYSVKYKNNKEVVGDSGDKAPTVEITAKADFAAGLSAAERKVVKTFSIASVAITKADIAEIVPQSFKNGQAVEPTVKVVVGGKTLKLNKDYIVVYKNNCMRYAVSEEDEDISKAPTATVIGIGNYTGEASVVFTIK